MTNPKTLIEQVREALEKQDEINFPEPSPGRIEMILKLVDNIENMCGILIDNKHCKLCVEMAEETIEDLKKELGIE